MGLGEGMQSVLAGFATIAVIIALGALLAHTRVLDVESQGMLARLSFFVASPALMVTVLGRTDVSQLFSANLLASLGSVAVTASIAVVLARLLWRRSASDTVIATFCASYVNAGNLGLPIAAYVLGDASLIAPMLLAQLLDRKSTRLNSSHANISYAVFCLKKKNNYCSRPFPFY